MESQLRAVSDTYHPAPLHLFSTLDRDITLSFISDSPHAARVGTARMEAFCRRHGYTGHAPAAALFVDQVRLLNSQIRACDQRIDQLLEAGAVCVWAAFSSRVRRRAGHRW
ncbi:hypothetical protein ACWDA3_38710 [Nonomuraea rubra]